MQCVNVIPMALDANVDNGNKTFLRKKLGHFLNVKLLKTHLKCTILFKKSGFTIVNNIGARLSTS